ISAADAMFGSRLLSIGSIWLKRESPAGTSPRLVRSAGTPMMVKNTSSVPAIAGAPARARRAIPKRRFIHFLPAGRVSESSGQAAHGGRTDRGPLELDEGAQVNWSGGPAAWTTVSLPPPLRVRISAIDQL